MANWLKSEQVGRDTLSKLPTSVELEAKINHLQDAWFQWRYPMILFTLFVFAIGVTHSTIEGNWQKLFESPKNIVTFFSESLWPPDWSVIEPQAYPVCEEPKNLEFTCSTAWIGVLETLKIAFVATVFGMAISYPIAILAAENLSPGWISYPARIFLAAFRSLPSILWAILFVIMVGLGPMAGILAMTLYTVGYLGKLQYEAIEGVAKPQLDASRAMGHGWFERSFGVVLPESANNLISQAIFMFEYNFRHGTVIGIVGAGGIGYYISLYLKFLQYDKVLAYVIIIFIVVILIDLLSKLVRSLFKDDKQPNRPPWWAGLFLPYSWTRNLLKKKD